MKATTTKPRCVVNRRDAYTGREASLWVIDLRVRTIRSREDFLVVECTLVPDRVPSMRRLEPGQTREL